MKEKIKALAEYLELDPNVIEYNENRNEFLTSEGTFSVMTEDEANKAHYEYIDSCIDDMGLDSFSEGFRHEVEMNYVDQDDFKEICREDYENYASDIENQTFDVKYANRLIDECVEAGIIDENDLDEEGEYQGDLSLREELTDYKVDQIDNEYNGNFAEWYKDDFGNDSLTEIIRSRSYILDVEAISKACIDCDGYGHNLASWDGKTIEQGEFYIFKQSNTDERSIDFITEHDDRNESEEDLSEDMTDNI